MARGPRIRHEIFRVDPSAVRESSLTCSTPVRLFLIRMKGGILARTRPPSRRPPGRVPSPSPGSMAGATASNPGDTLSFSARRWRRTAQPSRQTTIFHSYRQRYPR